MALHTQLPIYKVAYDLLDVITDLAKNMPRDFKQSIGGRVGDRREINNKHPTITMSKVSSSQLHSIGYDPTTQTMAIQFFTKDKKPGSIYHYANVSPEKHAEFIKADSIGSHFGKVFKNNVKDHPFTKIT